MNQYLYVRQVKKMKKSWIISSIVAIVSISYILCVALGYMEGDDIMQGSALLLTIISTWIIFKMPR
jgi:hypothetical protein